MKVENLINQLKEIQESKGNIEVVFQAEEYRDGRYSKPCISMGALNKDERNGLYESKYIATSEFCLREESLKDVIVINDYISCKEEKEEQENQEEITGVNFQYEARNIHNNRIGVLTEIYWSAREVYITYYDEDDDKKGDKYEEYEELLTFADIVITKKCSA
jgi:hypothetical protein